MNSLKKGMSFLRKNLKSMQERANDIFVVLSNSQIQVTGKIDQRPIKNCLYFYLL